MPEQYTVQDLQDALYSIYVDTDRVFLDRNGNTSSDEEAVREHEIQMTPSYSDEDNDHIDQRVAKNVPRYQYGKELLKTLKVVSSEASVCLSNEHLTELAEKETLVSPAIERPCGWVATEEKHCWQALALRRTAKKEK